MTKHSVTLCGISLGIGLMIALAPEAALSQAQPQRGQQPATGSRGAAPRAATPYVPPKTPWGEPDLQGMWPLDHLITTPLVRRGQYGDRRFLTEEEYAAAQKAAATRVQGQIDANIPTSDAGPASRLTSLISDPPDGQFPALTPKGQEMLAQLHGSYKPRTVEVTATDGSRRSIDIFDNINDFDTWDRCITRGLPVSMLTRNYNVGLRVMQSPGYVIILMEMAHEARIIPTDGRPNLDPSIKQYLGESRGRWEGNTLVIETLNFNGKPAMTNRGIPGSPTMGLNPQSESMRIVERLTRTSPTTIDYKMTIEDPVVLTRPWSVEFPWELHPDYGFYEFACHEGNTAVRNYIETSRFERANPIPPAGARGGRGGGGGGGAPAGGGAGGGGRGGQGGGRGGTTPPAPGTPQK
jgi:uncharacterized membrane protein YgcG